MSVTEPGDTLDLTSARPQYDEYEDPEVEWLDEAPAHWETARFRFLLETSPSKTEVRDLPDTTEVSFVPMESVKENGGLDLGETKEIEEVIDGYTYFRDGDVLVAKITPCFENRKGALASDLTNGIGFGTTELHVLRPGPDLDERFLYYVTMSHPFRKIGESTMYGAGGQKRVSNDFVENLRWPVPSPPEQDAIATFLDRETGRIDALIEKKEELIDLLEEKRTALISRVVTKGLDRDAEMQDSGVDWLGKIPEHWEMVPFGYYCDILAGKVDPESDQHKDRILISPDHVEQNTGNLFELETADDQGASSQKYVAKPGDLIYSKIRPELNKVCISEGNWLCSADMYPLRIRKGYDAQYLKYLMLSRQFMHLMVSNSMRVAMPKVNRDTLNAARIPLPSLPEQCEIASHLEQKTSRIDVLKSQIEKAIDRLKEYRTALISAAVTGQIDVREESGTAPVDQTLSK